RHPATPLTAEVSCDVPRMPQDQPFSIAAATRRDTNGRFIGEDHFNGKLEAPRVLHRAITDTEAQRLLLDAVAAARDPGLVAAWDFSLVMDSTTFSDIGPNRFNGQLVNVPTRGMTGWRWSGAVHCWKNAPEEYAAIHFHEDDLYDADWEPDFAVSIPDDAASGVYAACLRTGDETECIPFFVRPSRGRVGADLLLLLPTASYLAYANEHLGLHVGETEALSGHVSALQKEDIYLSEHPELGLSLYDTHSDGSGVSYSSRLRPILNFRPGRLSAWIGSNPRVPWQFNADLDLVAFLERKGIAYDVATDEDLHHEGLALLSRYRMVMTGTHPEYYSTPMHDAVRAWLDRGGRLMYTGGNGFYWRIAFHDDIPGVIELRRAEDGIRDWVSEPGEYYHSFTGELGGLWRRIGRPPQELVGVGMATQGFDYSGYYRRAPGAAHPRAAFIVSEIDDEIIGDFGHIGGGAAGLELDRADPALGTPDHALVIASSEGHTSLTFAVPEEVDNVSDELVAPRNPSLRGDVVFFETGAGGAVFSTGSIAWAGSLAHAGYDNNVARMTENVVRRFLDPAPFSWPGEA
ncbi:MAG TPA: N,N-dimethylformamidase beta subunit family domain-containing protein, partial [Alphaproteobacteria bacterium]|nr:N,N-dimethylformamidase beta subunit family domain-containing protein [Alphaproteobacteria bacterium]